MRFIPIIVSFFLFNFPVFSYASEITLMDCEWVVPDRFAKWNDALWRSESGSMAVIYFENDHFKKDIIENSLSQSELTQSIIFTMVDNGYKITAYSRHVASKENVAFPSWVVIENLSKKGVIYLNGLELGELFEFVSLCMPNFISLSNEQ